MVAASLRQRLEPVALTLLRITVGVIMTAHGWGKLNDIPGTISVFQNIGIPNPQIAVYLAIAGELGGGLGLLFGCLTPLAAFGILCTMAMAVFKVHWANGLMAKDNGFEYPLTLLAVSFYFMIKGAGPISMDAYLCKKCKAKASCCS